MTTVEINQWLQDAVVECLVDIVKEEVGSEFYVCFDSAEYGFITIKYYPKDYYRHYEQKSKVFSYREALTLYINGEDDE